MKTLAVVIIVLAGTILLLRSDFLPWKLVAKSELQDAGPANDAPTDIRQPEPPAPVQASSGSKDKIIQDLLQEQQRLKTENRNLQVTANRLQTQLNALREGSSAGRFFEDPDYKTKLDKK